MDTSVSSARFDDDSIWVDLTDGRTIGVPLAWFPRLLSATAQEREAYTLSARGLHWDGLDEDISVAGLLAGRADRSALEKRTDSDPRTLEAALHAALATVEPLARGDARDGLTREEQAMLRDGGLVLEPLPGEDPLTRTAATFAALIASALSTGEASGRLGRGEARVRQMLVDRSLASFLIDGVRYLPAWQFAPDAGLVPNVTVANRALRPALHPVEVYRWMHRPNEDLFLDDDIDRTVAPLAWLSAGHDPERVATLAARL